MVERLGKHVLFVKVFIFLRKGIFVMPLPLIIGIGAAIASAVGGGVAMLSAKDKIKNAKERYDRRRRFYSFAESFYLGRKKKAEAKFEALGQRRLEALVTMGRAVDFLKKAKIRKRDLEQRFEITPQKLAAWEGVSAHAVEVLGGIAKSGAAGVATATGVYGAVGVFGTASTGTAIGTLSGAAAKSATLAWLGGGSLAAGGGGVALGTVVFGGLVAGPALLVAGFFANSKAEKVKTEVEKKIAEMDVAEAQMNKQIAVLKTVLLRVDELYKSTDEVDRALDQLLNQGTPANLEDAYKVARTASSLGDLLDVAIVNENGNIIP